MIKSSKTEELEMFNEESMYGNRSEFEDFKRRHPDSTITYLDWRKYLNGYDDDIAYEYEDDTGGMYTWDMIKKDISNIRLITIAGPSSSGKTTFSNRLRVALLNRGIKPIRISIDNYYLERKYCPLDEEGNYDLEHIEAIDIDLFNKQMLSFIIVIFINKQKEAD